MIVPGIDSQVRKDLVRVAVTMALSILGLTLHNVREFGINALFAWETGTIPMAIIGTGLVLGWALVPPARIVCVALMVGFGLLNLLGGGVLSVLPLPFLPYEPEQTIAHYTSHILYGITQIPLIWLGFCLFLQKTALRQHELSSGSER